MNARDYQADRYVLCSIKTYDESSRQLIFLFVCRTRTNSPPPPLQDISVESQTTRTRDNTRPARGHHPYGYQANGSAEFISRCCLFERINRIYRRMWGGGACKLDRNLLYFERRKGRRKYNVVRKTILRFLFSYVYVPTYRVRSFVRAKTIIMIITHTKRPLALPSFVSHIRLSTVRV